MNEIRRKPIYMEICDQLRQQIISQHLSADERVPSSRNYAQDLGVSRTSVVAALEQLKAEGYLRSKRGSGYFVNPTGNLDTIDIPKNETGPTIASSEPESARPIIHPGDVDMQLFPYRRWAKCATKIARQHPKTLIESKHLFGDQGLRESIARYLYDWRGIDVSPRQILITAGSIDALEICVRTLMTQENLIGLENPGYLPLRSFVKQLGLSTVWLPVDAEGAQTPNIAIRKRGPKIVVLTPSHQFPLGGAMSPGRRAEFLQWAANTDSWIVEDDYDSEFRYAGRPIPALAGLDNQGRTIYVGSFAKIFSTGLRLGYLVTPAKLIDNFTSTLERFSTKASVCMQRVLSEFMDNGEFYRHIRRVRRIYGERRRILINCLTSELHSIVEIDDYQAGTQLVAQLSAQYDDSYIAQVAQKNGLPVLPLSAHYNGRSKTSGLVLGFCRYQNDEIVNNIQTLRKIILNTQA